MITSEALNIIKSLAGGLHPITGEQLSSEEIFHISDVKDALSIAVNALEILEKKNKPKELPVRAGNSWDVEEDKKLCEEFDGNKSIKELAELHNRSNNAIKSRLMRLGKLTPQGEKI